MSRSVKFYYGLSGTFKGTTIKSLLKPGDDVLWSGIKRWKSWEKLLDGRLESNNLNLALLHLSRLSDKEFNLALDDRDLYVERGVSDMLFYWLQNSSALNSEIIIPGLIEEELKISKTVSGGQEEPEKILLVQRDYDFIEHVVFSEPTRRNCFPGGIRDYIDAQDRYVKFTKTYNKISNVIYIDNAKEYLSSIGVVWDSSVYKK